MLSDTVNTDIKHVTTFELAGMLSVTYRTLIDLCKNPEYSHFKIPKKKGGFRHIQSPSKDLKKVHDKLKELLTAKYVKYIPDQVHGVRTSFENQTRNIRTNALPHVNRKYLLNIDLTDFYPSIKSATVYRMFNSSPFNLNEDMAACLTLLTTYNKCLPIGSPCSPIIANFVCIEMDKEIQEFCGRQQFVYTRYVDDLTFSSHRKFSSYDIDKITAVFDRYGFIINQSKFRVSGPYGAKYVTGIKVNEKINIDRKYIRHIRAILHDCKMNGLSDAKYNFEKSRNDYIKDVQHFSNIIKGKIEFVGHVRGREDNIYLKLYDSYKKLFADYLPIVFESQVNTDKINEILND